jgi:heme/copper-type cytochrome/quinol oxidase subunit 2
VTLDLGRQGGTVEGQLSSTSASSVVGLSTLDLTKGETGMTIAALTWPAAAVWIALILFVGLVAAVLVWSIFRARQAATHSESRGQAG